MARIAVVGLWHLGCVVAAALASLGHQVRATDPDATVVKRLQEGRLPIYEPGLSEAVEEQAREGRLSFAPTAGEAFAGVEAVFVTFDTPVDAADQGDLTPIEQAFESIGREATGELELVLMSQVPVGTCRRLVGKLREQAPGLRFSLVYQPENLRLGEALRTFLRPDFIVLGVEEKSAAEKLLRLYAGIQAPHVTMSWESAEMTKHALNAFLATSVSFANELAELAEAALADIRDVVRAMRLDRRIGPHAFLNPGLGFSGGTLARDLEALRQLAAAAQRETPLLDGVRVVNTGRVKKIAKRICEFSGSLRGARVGLLGLTYKPGTSTLRRSAALALARLLVGEGAEVQAHDPQVVEPSGETDGIHLCPDPYQVARGADAVVLTTPWPEFKALDFVRLQEGMRQAILIDPHNFLDEQAVCRAGLHYVGSGRSESVGSGATR